MSPNPMHDLPAPHIDGVHHRREAAPKPKEMRPLLTREPLSHDREKKPTSQPPKKRKRVMPTTPALTFDPKRRHVPSGRQDPPESPSVYSRPSTSESSASSYDEQQTTPFPDREIHGQFHDGYEAQKRPRIFPECSSTERSTSFYPDTPCTDVRDMNSVPPPPEFYDSPASYTSSSSPAPSDQSPCVEFTVPVIGYARHSMYGYGDEGQVYVQQPVVHQDPYGFSMGPCADRSAQGYPVQYSDPTYGRLAPHGVPAYPENDGYPYPPRRY